MLDEIAAVIGVDAAVSLAKEFGGQRLYVPRTFAEGGRVVRAIGAERARLLAEHYYGYQFELPIRMRRLAIVRSLASSDPKPTIDRIAALAGITRRAVFKILAEDREPRGDPRQIDLFGER